MRSTSRPRPRATRGSSTAARRRLPKRVRDSTSCSASGSTRADHDHEEPVLADADLSKSKPALQPGRQLHVLLHRADEVVDRRHGHEDEADREQHLVEMRPRVHRPVEGALEQRAEQRRGDERDRQASQERQAGTVHQQHRDVAAGHREGAVSEVDEVHQPERHGQPDREHEQQHPVGDAVEQQGQHLERQAGRERVGAGY